MDNENNLNYDSLEIDKSDDYVNYCDRLHKYWTKTDKLNCISVTTLIHKFTTFDEGFWSSYKALVALISVDEFKSIKKELLNTHKFTDKVLEDCNITKEDFNKKRTEILSEWEDKRNASCERGTIFHKERELGHLNSDTPELKKLGLGGKFSPITTNKIDTTSQKVYPELLISWVSEDGTLRLAGQADLVILDKNKLYLIDYKSNKSIDKKSFFDSISKKSQMMKYPLNHLQDSNFWHYTMQLSTYAWMLKQKNPEIQIEKLIIEHYDHNSNLTSYECEYLEKDVLRMLSFYKEELKYEEFKKATEKIIF